MANRAGLSMQAEENFLMYFIQHMKNGKSYKEIYEAAQVSERMFRYIREQHIPTKETLLALMISLGLESEEINQLLPRAGYILSNSVIYDMVIKQLIVQTEANPNGLNPLSYINEGLYDLDLPLLMTREKNNPLF